MMPLTITALVSGGVITNYHCISRCGHCLYNCSPQRPRDYLDGETAANIFERIRDLGCRSVHIGGGEPLLDPEKLADVAAAARDTGVGIDYVETNSGWFTEAESADAILQRLIHAGVGTLLVSISPFHNAHIPFSRVRGVIDACRRTGMQVFPWVNAFIRDLERLGEDRPHAMDEFEAAFGNDYLKRVPDRYWIHLGGRSLNTFRPVFASHPVTHILNHSPRSCARALADTTHFHMDLYGGYIPGLCAGLSVRMTDLGRPLSAAAYPLIDALAAAGINGLYDMATGSHGYIPGKAAFLNHCDLCTDIRRFLWQQDRSRFSELSPDGFYRELAVE